MHRVSVLYKQGLTVEEIGQTYPHLALAQIHTALAYFHSNRAEIEVQLAEDDAEYDNLRAMGGGE